MIENGVGLMSYMQIGLFGMAGGSVGVRFEFFTDLVNLINLHIFMSMDDKISIIITHGSSNHYKNSLLN